MGSSASCLCPENSTKTREVIVMKENGESIRFAGGTHVKDILALNPHHKIIQCCSARLVLSGLSQLSFNRLYFLVSEGFVVSDESYESLIRIAVSKELIYAKAICGTEDRKAGSEFEIDGGDDCGYRKSPWKPALQTIPEVISPPLLKNV